MRTGPSAGRARRSNGSSARRPAWSGLYEGERLIGFARTVSDGQSFAYLADVYVLPEYRGRGLGVGLVREAVENGPYADRRWLLHTEDAHALYERLGFTKPGYKLMEREPD